MPYSYSLYKNEFFNHMKENFDTEISILDVGAGSGSYGILLKETFPNIDGIEIYPNYSDMFNLKQSYRNLYIGNILNFDFSQYNYIILGDIIEHLSVNDAFLLLHDIFMHNIKCMVSVPYLFEQGEEYGNKHEIHLQSDLTHEIFLQRYPTMNLLWKDDNYGYYINY